MNLRFPAALLVCALLLTNPLWLFPHAADRPFVYTAEPYPDPAAGDPGLEFVPGDLVGLACDDEGGHGCAAEAAMARANRTAAPTAASGDGPPPYLATRDGYYERVTVKADDGTGRYAWRPVASVTVRAEIARPIDHLPADLQSLAREGGSLRRLEPLSEHRAVGDRERSLLIRLDAAQPEYRVLTVQRAPADRVPILVGRALLGLLGLALVYVVHRRSLPDQHATLLYADDRTI